MTRSKPTIITAAGEEIEAMPANGKDFSLKELQDIVGGLIQIVRTKNGKTMICDEEGRLKGKEINEKATKLYEFGSLDPVDWMENKADFVTGTVIVFPRKYPSTKP